VVDRETKAPLLVSPEETSVQRGLGWGGNHRSSALGLQRKTSSVVKGGPPASLREEASGKRKRGEEKRTKTIQKGDLAVTEQGKDKRKRKKKGRRIRLSQFSELSGQALRHLNEAARYVSRVGRRRLGNCALTETCGPVIKEHYQLLGRGRQRIRGKEGYKVRVGT